MWEKLSNPGDTLKLILPSSSVKAISLVNYSSMVTIYKIIERARGNRGSKSDFNFKKSVKEQRVYGSLEVNNFTFLRCTLTGFARNYQVRIPSNQINTQIKNSST
jgi:hypothetical protein